MNCKLCYFNFFCYYFRCKSKQKEEINMDSSGIRSPINNKTLEIDVSISTLSDLKLSDVTDKGSMYETDDSFYNNDE